MNQKQKGECFLVVGPESAGNRLAASLLVAAGCHGQAATDQEWDKTLPKGESPAVVIRSFPHGDEWPHLRNLIRTLAMRDYRVTLVITVREPKALASSQVFRGHCKPGEAEKRIKDAYRHIVRDIGPADDFVFWPYEAVALDPQEAANGLFERLGLPPTDVSTVVVDHEKRPVTNENAKHY